MLSLSSCFYKLSLINCLVYASSFSWSQFSYSIGDNIHQWHMCSDIIFFPAIVAKHTTSPETKILVGTDINDV